MYYPYIRRSFLRFIRNHNTASLGSAGFQRREAGDELLTTPACNQFLRRAAAAGTFLSVVYGRRAFQRAFLFMLTSLRTLPLV